MIPTLHKLYLAVINNYISDHYVPEYEQFGHLDKQWYRLRPHFNLLWVVQTSIIGNYMCTQKVRGRDCYEQWTDSAG